MRGWETASLAFFTYVAAVALLPRYECRVRLRVIPAAAAALGVTAAAMASPYMPIAHDWLVPPALLFLGYWTGGMLFVAPIAWQERILVRIDETLRVVAVARRTPRAIASVLEAAYGGVYLLVPIALVLHLSFDPAPDAARFWTVILATDYVCFAVLPWVQTRPPRAIEGTDPWDVPLRRFNLRVLGATSIQVNTFPSGHAAEALAAMLLVLGVPSIALAPMIGGAAAVSAGAVFGRYHYALDAIAGWLAAIAVWWAVMAFG